MWFSTKIERLLQEVERYEQKEKPNGPGSQNESLG